MWSADPTVAQVRSPDEGAQPEQQLQAWDSRRSMLVTRPGAEALAAGAEGKEGKKRELVWAARNPVSHWRVSETRINDFAFSPDFPHVAVAADDGMMRLIDVQDERLEASFGSYFGAFTCLVWSPDGRFLLTGSCDDLVTIWAPREGRIVARCPGHASFVRGIAFDPWRWRADDRIYRFASVGEDNRVILWDFSSAALHRPKGHAHSHAHSAAAAAAALSSAHKRPSIGSTLSLSHDAARRTSLSARRASMGLELGAGSAGNSQAAFAAGDAVSHEAAGRGLVAELQPIASYTIPPPSDGAKDDLLAAVRFSRAGMLLLHRTGAVRHLDRPAPPASGEAQPRSSMAARRHVRM